MMILDNRASGIKSKITTMARADHDHRRADHGAAIAEGAIAEGVGFEPTRTLPRPSGFQVSLPGCLGVR